MQEICHCGIVACARCARCGENRCANHYYLRVDFSVNMPYEVHCEAPGNSKAIVRLDRDRSYAEAWAAGGPGCDQCREQAGGNAKRSRSSQLDRRIEEFCGAPSLAELRHLAEYSEHGSGMTDERASRVLERLAPALGLDDSEILSITMSPHDRYYARRFRKHKPVIQVTSREPATRAGFALITKTGVAYATIESSDLAIESEVHAILAIKLGAPIPQFEYVSSYSDTPARWRLPSRFPSPFIPALARQMEPMETVRALINTAR